MNSKPFDAGRASLVGNRKLNQDRSLLLTHHNTTLLAIADGLGGHPRGEVAAQLFVDVCETLFRQQAKPLQDPEQFMVQCIHQAHQAIIEFGDRQDPPLCPRTTAVMAVVQNGTAYWVHVGDSRLYLIRDRHVMAQTRDHSLVQYIRPATGDRSQARSSITRCLGGLDQPPTITCGSPTRLLADDVLLLCTDGLWGQVPQQKIVESLSRDQAIVDGVAELAEEARQRGYPRSDNVTLLAIRWCEQAAEAGADSSLEEHLEAAVRHLHQVLKHNKSS